MLPQILRTGPSALRALLQTEGQRTGNKIAWARCVQSDLELMHALLPGKTYELGSPNDYASRWHAVMRHHPSEWRALVDTIFFTSDAAQTGSPTDRPTDLTRPAARPELIQPSPLGFKCADCGAAFKSNKAMLQHQRVKHGLRTEFAAFVGEKPQCPVCGKMFATRWRAIAHLSENRQRRVTAPAALCRQAALDGLLPRLNPSLVESLLLDDRAARGVARKQGHSHAIVGRKHANKRRADVLEIVPTRRVRTKTGLEVLTKTGKAEYRKRPHPE